MPFKSKAQARYLYAKHPEIAQEFSEHTKSIKALPQHVKGDRKMKEKSMHHKKAEHHMEKAAHHHEKAKHHMEKAKHHDAKMKHEPKKHHKVKK